MRQIPKQRRCWNMNVETKQSIINSLAFFGITRGDRIRRRKFRVTILTLTLALSLALVLPVRTVRGAIVDTGLAVTNSISMDEYRIVSTRLGASPGVIFYDALSGMSTI